MRGHRGQTAFVFVQPATITVDRVTFHKPVQVGQLLMVHGRLTYVGNTSMEVELCVEAEDLLTGEHIHTNSAYIVYVALDDDRRPMQVPPLDLQTEDDRRRYDEGKARTGIQDCPPCIPKQRVIACLALQPALSYLCGQQTVQTTSE